MQNVKLGLPDRFWGVCHGQTKCRIFNIRCKHYSDPCALKSKDKYTEYHVFILYENSTFLKNKFAVERKWGERWGRELSHMRDQCEDSAEKTTRMKWQVEPASWKNRNSETGDTGCMWAESWNVCLREQICVCDLIQYKAGVWNIVRLQQVQLKQAIFLVKASKWLPHNPIKNIFTREPEVGCVLNLNHWGIWHTSLISAPAVSQKSNVDTIWKQRHVEIGILFDLACSNLSDNVGAN